MTVPMLTGRCQIIAECASNHGGRSQWIATLIKAAAASGADIVKFQAYQTKFLNPADPQFAWFKQAELSFNHITSILTLAQAHRIIPMFSVFDAERMRISRLFELGVRYFKIGHATPGICPADHLTISELSETRWYQSFAWGRGFQPHRDIINLSVIPLYPAPLHALAATAPREGYSDHCMGLEACQIMLARGATVIEKHFSTRGCPRRQPWDMDERGLKSLRAWADICTTVTLGTNQMQRWMHGPY